jgi:RNA polymerase sigma-70 factor (ECF subfamily)
LTSAEAGAASFFCKRKKTKFFSEFHEPRMRLQGIMVMQESFNQSELLWLHRAREGDPDAFGFLVTTHAETLFRWAMPQCRDRHEAEEVVQATFLEAWKSLPRFSGQCRFTTWLYGILRFRLYKNYNRRRRDEMVATAWIERAGNAAATQNDPAKIMELRDESRRIREAVAELPEEQRAVIELRFFADAHLEEIASLLGIPLGTVKSRLHHGLEKLRRTSVLVNLGPSQRHSSSRSP